MPTISFDPKTGSHSVVGEITSVNVNSEGSTKTTQTEDNGVLTTLIEFKNGGYVSSTPNGNGFSISAKDVLLTYSDDPKIKGGVIVSIKMDETIN
ncbi:hypothetical protein [Yersinia proxima]|uniref:hypothetical protein n=1 Tax=Yersinia proxima TaxID=2890316 RepID=UPI001D1121ED|nr:hypothetical protein [Yersinia proxima]